MGHFGFTNKPLFFIISVHTRIRSVMRGVEPEEAIMKIWKARRGISEQSRMASLENSNMVF